MSISNVENVAPNVLRKISKELAELVSDPPEGIKIIPNEEDVSDIQAIIDGPAGTPYQNGCFRVKLALGKTFPVAPPKGYFLTKIFHPNVSRNGEICVNTLKKDWNESLGIKHILLIIKCLLIVPNAESALNEDAAKLMLEDYDEYFHRAKMITEVHAKKCDAKIKIDDYPNDSTSNSSSSPRKLSTNELMPLSKRPANSSSHPSMIKQTKPTTSNKGGNNNNNNKKRALKRL